MTPHAASADAGAFRAFEHAGWNAIPGRYDEGFSGLTPQAAEPLLDAAAVSAGSRVLDVATGPGYVAAAAAARGASVVALDFSRAMVEQARRRLPRLEVLEGDAERLGFKDERFDAVVMNFGLLHLADPERAIAEAARVLRPGGRFAFTVWAAPELTAGFGAVLRAVAAHGTTDVALPEGPPFFRFSDPHECRRALRAAGFDAPLVSSVELSWRLRDADDLFAIMHDATVRTAGLLRSQPPAALHAIRTALREEVARYRSHDGFVLPMPAVLAAATRP